jgi:uncharacterized protein (TIGR00645 family)
MSSRYGLDRALERGLFAARWILAPIYCGMILALVAIVVVFFRELIHDLARLPALDSEQMILLTLSLIDLTLTASLLLIVMFAGYENFVSPMHLREGADRPEWMGTIDFSGLKIKLIASIVAISAIALLRAFLPLGDPQASIDTSRLRWMVIVHLTFVVSAVALVVMDYIAARTASHR